MTIAPQGASLLALLLLTSGSVAPRLAPVQPNDNRVAAGRLDGGVLRVSLEARQGTAYMEGPDGPAFEVEAFGEVGRPLQSPGPLIRVPQGTQVVATVRNTLARPMMLRGLNDRASGIDSLNLAPGEVREIRFQAGTPGTYYYWGRTTAERSPFGIFEDSHLLGGFIVDPPGGSTDDRLLVIGLWEDRNDPTERRHTFLVNGLSWPHTERLMATVGDSVRLRVINASPGSHPMHLHGFYFTATARGDGRLDTLYQRSSERLAVTEFLAPRHTTAFTWVPKRSGNWLFHCHFIGHISTSQHLAPRPEASQPENHALDGMAGLITGIVVAERPGAPGIRGEAPRRRLRLYANARPGHYGDRPGYGFILQEGERPPAADSIRIPGTPIMLRRDEPVEITVFNRTPSPVTVHWHGIELDSYYDGVAGWSGEGAQVAPLIAPGDSFNVQMTPDRAGTFIYHTHADEAQQLASGLYGPLVILAPGETWDPAIERILLLGWGGPGPDAPPLLNGSADPAPLQLSAGRTYRLRFINITPSNNQRVRLLADSVPVHWRRFAKDGAAVEPHHAVEIPAVLSLGAGETYDFEFSPSRAGTFLLEITTGRRARPPAVMKVGVEVR
jgi:FtsP/CotA-like multicopper oxidase with cupredoxin domain